MGRLTTAVAVAVAVAGAKWQGRAAVQQVKRTRCRPGGQLRFALAAFYGKYAPDESLKVENLVARVVGGPPSEVGGMMVGGVLWSEEELFGKLEAKYGGKVEWLMPVDA